ncbi:PPK2 family polyphosphate kinase [Corynebacterium halotolerans]|uniref:Polyphosphate kinase-2-related domain-containing protein n=1 Tax=Corynebacterium halotolerans YIM 70093 = DSM 44683 TaxID=1121362 RepID=M1MXW2_9CORY|nr:PPK2 family polyphosphate kinase [Corynebacterium halotolerans]AGF72574.1 hypothetical protein A605_07860 [Corynebacterium halotolerans YIM 70093 = DSM 44683]
MSDFTVKDALALRVGEGFRLRDVDPASTPGFTGGEKKLDRAFDGPDDELKDLQRMLHANALREDHTGAVLLILQGMDTSGKGGVIRKVFKVFSPQGVDTVAFGRPTEQEQAHDFLWRIRQHEPEPGRIVVFDRSHYEDVLVHRVQQLSPADEIERRYGAIVDFENGLAERHVRIVKVMLHISKEFQRENLAERLERRDKHWKYDPDDITQRLLWDEYMEAFEIAMTRTSTDAAPWYCVPGDNKDYARMVVKHLLLDALRSFDMDWPEPHFDVEEERRRLAES